MLGVVGKDQARQFKERLNARLRKGVKLGRRPREARRGSSHPCLSRRSMGVCRRAAGHWESAPRSLGLTLVSIWGAMLGIAIAVVTLRNWAAL
jgi:hypothetical protein